MVVTVGLTFVEPLTDVDVNVPGVMAIVAAPLVDQLSVLLEPGLMLSGPAANELIVGSEPFPGGIIGEIAALQPASKTQADRMRTCALISNLKDLNLGDLGFLVQEGLGQLVAAKYPLFKVWPHAGGLHVVGQFRSG